jgi:hypothetical protein
MNATENSQERRGAAEKEEPDGSRPILVPPFGGDRYGLLPQTDELLRPVR